MKRNQGFSVTELMIAIVIIGVLATLAIPSFTSYIYKARVTEATNFLGQIKQRQEAYRNEFGQYCDVSASITTFYPSTLPGADPVTWDSGSARWIRACPSPGCPESCACVRWSFPLGRWPNWSLSREPTPLSPRRSSMGVPCASNSAARTLVVPQSSAIRTALLM